MKKLIISTTIILSFLFLNQNIKAQSNWELGGRFGDDFSLDVTIPLAKSPRVHGALYFGSHISAGAYFDWMFKLSDGPDGLKFYPGVGADLHFSNSLGVAAVGDFGAEYSFKFPLTVGIDWRPSIMLTNSMNFYAGNWGILARFRFGEGTKFVKTN